MFRRICVIIYTYEIVNLQHEGKADEGMTETELFIFLGCLLLLVIVVAVIAVVASVSGAAAAIADEDDEEE